MPTENVNRKRPGIVISVYHPRQIKTPIDFFYTDFANKHPGKWKKKKNAQNYSKIIYSVYNVYNSATVLF